MKPLLPALSISAFTLAASTLSAQVITATPTLPASPPAYYTNSSSVIGYTIPGGGTIYSKDFGLSAWTPTTFSNAVLAYEVSVDDVHFFPSLAGTGPGAWTGNNPNITGTFPTEMTALLITSIGPFGPLWLRESPTHASTGQTTVTAIGGGQFSVSSFFDVFTELSTDGGATWVAANSSLHLDLQTVPEPTTAALLTLALSAMVLRRRRQTRR